MRERVRYDGVRRRGHRSRSVRCAEVVACVASDGVAGSACRSVEHGGHIAVTCGHSRPTTIPVWLRQVDGDRSEGRTSSRGASGLRTPAGLAGHRVTARPAL
jgi:hypothetical protein